jgi:hypothetical protein
MPHTHCDMQGRAGPDSRRLRAAGGTQRRKGGGRSAHVGEKQGAEKSRGSPGHILEVLPGHGVGQPVEHQLGVLQGAPREAHGSRGFSHPVSPREGPPPLLLAPVTSKGRVKQQGSRRWAMAAALCGGRGTETPPTPPQLSPSHTTRQKRPHPACAAGWLTTHCSFTPLQGTHVHTVEKPAARAN